jgi:hypothetical protein
MIAPYLGHGTQEKLARGPAAFGLFFLYFLMFKSDRVMMFAYKLMTPVAELLGVPFYQLVEAARSALTGHV